MRYAVASRKNTDSLVKGMILLDEGGGKRGGGIKVFDENGAPVSPLSACFFWVLALGFFLVVSPAQKNSRKLAGNSSTGPPIDSGLVIGLGQGAVRGKGGGEGDNHPSS